MAHIVVGCTIEVVASPIKELSLLENLRGSRVLDVKFSVLLKKAHKFYFN